MKKTELIKAIIIVCLVGILLTIGVNIYISGEHGTGAAMLESAIPETPGDVIGTLAPQKQSGPGVDNASEIVSDGVVIISASRGTYEDLRRKLDALDASLTAQREANSDTNAMAQKSREEAELNAWTAQVNVIYDTISDKLDETGKAALARSRMEKTEEISSSVDAARAWAYELLEQYKDVLE